MDGVDQRRLMAKVARMYYNSSLRQVEIANRLRISQTKVSRLLQQAEEHGIVQTIVVPLLGLNADIEEALERRYPVAETYVVDAVADDEVELTRELGEATASILANLPVDVPVVGINSWSRTLRHMIAALRPMRTGTTTVVEMLGDLGPPDQQHESARSTQRLASLTGADPVFLRTPGVVSAVEVRDALLEHNSYARHALGLLDALDLALTGVGTCEVVPPLRAGSNFFTAGQLADVVAAGAVGQVCLRFVDARGKPVASPLDDLVTGVTLDQMRAAKRRWVVAGGASKHATIRAVLCGGWADTFVTDAATARWLLSPEADLPS